MKILHLIDSGGLYGAEKMLLSLVEEQIREGLEPIILSAGEPGIDAKDIEKEAQIRGLPFTPWRMKRGFNLTEGLEVLNWARRNNIEILHSHGYKFNILLGIIPRWWRRIPIITTVHGYVRARRFSRMWLYEFLDHLVLPNLDQVVLVSESMKKELLGASKSTQVIPNGIDISAVKQATKTDLDGDIADFLARHTPIILGVGRLSPEKGFDVLIEAFAKSKQEFPDSGLLIVGEGRQRQALVDVAHKHRLGDAFMLPGFIENVPSVMARSDVLVMPSKTEGMPITVLEAMAVALPIIASSVGALPDLLQRGDAGTLLEVVDSRTLAESIKKTLLSNETRNSKARQAQALVERSFSTVAMSSAYSSVYKHVQGEIKD